MGRDTIRLAQNRLGNRKRKSPTTRIPEGQPGTFCYTAKRPPPRSTPLISLYEVCSLLEWSRHISVFSFLSLVITRVLNVYTNNHGVKSFRKVCLADVMARFFLRVASQRCLSLLSTRTQSVFARVTCNTLRYRPPIPNSREKQKTTRTCVISIDRQPCILSYLIISTSHELFILNNNLLRSFSLAPASQYDSPSCVVCSLKQRCLSSPHPLRHPILFDIPWPSLSLSRFEEADSR